MNRFDTIEDPRRRLLVQALTLGLFTVALPLEEAVAQMFGSRPQRLPPGQSIFRLSGTATVNGQPATLQTQIRPGDTIETGPKSELIFVVGEHSMLMRADTKLVLEGESAQAGSMFVAAMRILTGKLLTTSKDSKTRITTTTATIGIRGTGWYAESDPEQTYFCTCYGQTDVSSTADPTSTDTVTAGHHDKPLYILASAPAGQAIRPAPFINHTDQELSLIETLVGRSPPFVFPKDEYTGPRREY